MRSTLLLGMAIGLGSVLGGLTVAYYADLPPGGTIVLIAAATFLVGERDLCAPALDGRTRARYCDEEEPFGGRKDRARIAQLPSRAAAASLRPRSTVCPRYARSPKGSCRRS